MKTCSLQKVTGKAILMEKQLEELCRMGQFGVGVQAMLCAAWAGKWVSGASPLPLLQEGVSVDSKMAPETRHAAVPEAC